jgi:hypothetical protein
MTDHSPLDMHPYVDALPLLDPVIATERTDYGWRGLTQQGEVLEVKSGNGHAIDIPTEITVAHNNMPIGRRLITNERIVDIGRYLDYFNNVVTLYRMNKIDAALLEAEDTLKIAPTIRARFNRAMVLLAAGRWNEGFAEYWECEQHSPFIRPQVKRALAAGIAPWNGESLDGKTLLLMHAHGFGDTIQMLRYVRYLGGNVVLDVPDELKRIAVQFAPLWHWHFETMPDYFCPILQLLHFLKVMPSNVDGAPYIDAAPTRDDSGMRNVGLAWSIGKPSVGDYPREIQLGELVSIFGKDVELHSMQTQGADEANQLGIHTHHFESFSDCAALMLQMDAIVSIDTAALHLAGAIGHPKVFALLSHWHSWRWLAPWYNNVKLCRQDKDGDWASALEKVHIG